MTTTKDKSFFDLHTTGIGYLNRIREVTPRKGESFLACDISALNGPSDDVSYVRFDTRVSGANAQHLVRRCIEAVNAEKKVMIGFRLGDLWTDMYTPEKGKNAGKPCVSLKARLLFISWIKVDGVLSYKAEPKANVSTMSDTEAGVPSDAIPDAMQDMPADAGAPQADGPPAGTQAFVEDQAQDNSF